MSLLNALLPIATLILGSILTYLGESIRRRATRRESLEDSLLGQRTDAYVTFLEAAHSAAHLLGRTAVGCPDPLEASPKVYWQLDRVVARSMRRLELVGSDEVVRCAHQHRQALIEFRNAVSDERVIYESEDYARAYEPVKYFRDSLVKAARAELLR